MSAQADDDAGADELRRYAFHMEPQVEADGDLWTASYPGADWSASGPSSAEALERLGEEFIRRQNAGEDPLSYAEDVYRRHLREPWMACMPSTMSCTASWCTHLRRA